MLKHVPSVLVLVVLALACAGEASALVQRTFVSGLGLDTNPCSRELPCRTFAAAIAQTQPGGEVLALDSAGYGPVTITKSISLIAPTGIYAGITTTSATNAISVAAGANDVVVLRGLSLTGLGLGTWGVAFSSGKSLHVESLTISGFTNHGVNFAPAATAQLTVTDSLIRDTGQGGVAASAAPGGRADVAIDRTRLVGNIYGVLAGSNSRVSVRDTVAAAHVNGVGFAVLDASAVVSLEDCLATGGVGGILSFGLTRVAGTTVTNNTVGLTIGAGGSILSRGNNTVEGNSGNEVFTGAFAAK